MNTNSDGDTGRFKVLCDWEHDDPEQAPLYKQCTVVVPSPQTAKAIDLTGIFRMTAEQIDKELEEFQEIA